MNAQEIIKNCEKSLAAEFEAIDDTALFNQQKVLNAFQINRVAARHFAASTGYGYSDDGRDNLNKVFAAALGGEDAIVSPLLVSGTHAITVALFGLLLPEQTCLCITGTPYDTLLPVINGKGNGSLADYKINFDIIDLIDKEFDFIAIKEYLQNKKPQLIYIQRSKGYKWANALNLKRIAYAIANVKQYCNAPIMIDNCYGEFVQKQEPLDFGADIIAGSLIKNAGGGLAPTGGYIIGKQESILRIENRLTSPSIGRETGSYTGGYRTYYQGLFMAPHITAQALKSALLFSRVFSHLGYETLPKKNDTMDDIICAIKFNDKQKMLDFCKNIQFASPVDSYACPEPFKMPGYSNDIIMAAGTFVQGASIELSADGPVKPPYIAYVQGALTIEHSKIALVKCLENII